MLIPHPLNHRASTPKLPVPLFDDHDTKEIIQTQHEDMPHGSIQLFIPNKQESYYFTPDQQLKFPSGNIRVVHNNQHYVLDTDKAFQGFFLNQKLVYGFDSYHEFANGNKVIQYQNKYYAFDKENYPIGKQRNGILEYQFKWYHEYHNSKEYQHEDPRINLKHDEIIEYQLLREDPSKKTPIERHIIQRVQEVILHPQPEPHALNPG